MASIHQVNHPGRELKISFKNKQKHEEDYFFYQGSSEKGLRLWNRSKIKDKNNPHMRKFIEFKGRYISDLNNLHENEGLLRFWGEYEGYSEFELLKHNENAKYWDNACAIHRPFFNNKTGEQNTDPYIFGEEFYYAICKKPNLKNIQIGDLILFGSEFGERGCVKFYLDTLLVIKEKINIDFLKFDEIYTESTLKRLDTQGSDPKIKYIHTALKYQNEIKINQSIFSFVPCKISNEHNISFGRPIIDTTKYGDYLRKPGTRTGCKSKEIIGSDSIVELWKKIALEVLNQGFYLGTHFDNLEKINTLPK
jgi:hypothetical protein